MEENIKKKMVHLLLKPMNSFEKDLNKELNMLKHLEEKLLALALLIKCFNHQCAMLMQINYSSAATHLVHGLECSQHLEIKIFSRQP